MNTTTKKAKPPKIAKKKLLSWYRQMVTIRQFEEKVRELYEKSVMPGITHLSIGQEAVAVGVCGALQPADYITSTHRGHGHCLAKGADLGRMFAELMGKVDGYCRGKGGSMHIANQEAGHLGANAIIGGGMALATGAALSAKLRKSNQIAVCFFGDGALNQGIFFEAMNMAAIWQLPIIYACENNQYGEYTPMQRVTAGDVQARGQAFDIPSVGADGMDVIIAHEASVKAVKHVRDGKGPSFLIFDTYRYSGHGMSDQTRPYRSREEEREWREQRDPVDRLARQLIEWEHVVQSDLEVILEQVQEQVAAGVEFAQKSPYPDPQEVTKHVFSD